jgi:hypothetical protein
MKATRRTRVEEIGTKTKTIEARIGKWGLADLILMRRLLGGQ